jgi:hypothetical protein
MRGTLCPCREDSICRSISKLLKEADDIVGNRITSVVRPENACNVFEEHDGRAAFVDTLGDEGEDVALIVPCVHKPC